MFGEIVRKPKRFVGFSAPMLAHDGEHVAVRVHVEDGVELDLEIPLLEIGDIVQFLVELANHAGSAEFDGQKMHSPIPVQGLGIVAGRTPDETLLVVRLGGFELAFGLDSSRVAQLGHEFAKVAQAMSASGAMQ